MSIPKKQSVTLEEYHKMRQNSEELLEYVDGCIYMTPSPSTKHQRISSQLHAALFDYLKGKECEVFHAPFDIVLKNEGMVENSVVIPDLSVICDKSGFTDNNYVGVPDLIIEILSPSNQSHDLVFKLNLYMQYGVTEYWIVNPMLNVVFVYHLDENREYQQLDSFRGAIHSKVLEGFSVELDRLFL
ncbi:Uma2 family endonuclease [Halobacillus hunanensis]|uniref:Uma2 family endonuclease n=1 Tax=Halobacillus hunanensis TaxID=578214 RepID=UPI0009A72DC2|nr:Uma2 family endonuclease [Halobacillus hunanensis]